MGRPACMPLIVKMETVTPIDIILIANIDADYILCLL